MLDVRKHPAKLSTCAALLLTLAWTGPSRAAGPQVVIDYLHIPNAPAYSAYVDYRDASGRPVSKLDVQDLTLTIDDEPASSEEIGITQFKKSSEGVAFVLLVNNYKGYSTIFEEQKKGLIDFVRAMRTIDRAAVLYYSDKVVPVVEFSSDKEELTQAINSIPAPEKPQEVFLDAIMAALDRFPEGDPSIPRRRGLVMVSDALDQGLADKNYLIKRIKKDVEPKAKALGVKFYGLGYSIESREGYQLMSNLAKTMGGQFEEVRDAEVNRMGEKFTQLLDLVYGQYVISFVNDDLDPEVQHTLMAKINYKGSPVESNLYLFQTIPVPGTPWWVILLIVLGGLLGVGLIALLIFLILRKKPPKQEEEEEEYDRECPVCGEPLELEDRTCEVCMNTPHVAELKKIGGEWDGFVYIIRNEITTFGREEGDIIIEDPSVSRTHAGIKIDEMKFELADLNSSNGTFVNGKRIGKQFLKDGDQIKFGEVDLKFSLS